MRCVLPLEPILFHSEMTINAEQLALSGIVRGKVAGLQHQRTYVCTSSLDPVLTVHCCGSLGAECACGQAPKTKTGTQYCVTQKQEA